MQILVRARRSEYWMFSLFFFIIYGSFVLNSSAISCYGRYGKLLIMYQARQDIIPGFALTIEDFTI